MKIHAYAVLTIALLLSACSGGMPSTRTVVPVVASVDGNTPPATVPITLRLGVLKPSAHPAQTGGSEAWFSPAARSVSIEYEDAYGKGVRTFDVGPGETHCKAQALGSLCRIVVQAPKSAKHFYLNAYDGPRKPSGGVTGKLLAEANAYASKTGKLTFSVLGVWQKITVSSLNTAPANGSTTNLGLVLSIKDVDGYTVYGTYRGAVGVSFNEVPRNYANSFKFLVNGKPSLSIASSSDTYSAWYSGRGVISATMVVGSQQYGFRHAVIKPVPEFVPIAASPPLNVTSRIVTPADGTVLFTEPSGKVGQIVYGAYSEMALPSGHAITKLGVDYVGSSAILPFATAQNTVGLLQPSLEESPIVSGPAIVGIAYDGYSLAPLYAQSNGAISEYRSGSSPATQLEYQAPGAPNLTDFLFGVVGSGAGAIFGWVFTDVGNGATGLLQISSSSKSFSGAEQPLPPGGGTPAFSAVSPQGVVWTAIAGQPKVAIGSTVAATAAPLTSMAALKGLDSQYMAATDATGNIEIFNANGKRIATYTPSDGGASAIVWGDNSDFLYVCATCTHGLHEFVY